MTTINNYDDLAHYPEGTVIEDYDGDTGTKQADGLWDVVGYANPKSAGWFEYPVTVKTQPVLDLFEDVPADADVEDLKALDALPDGTMIQGRDPQRTLRFKQSGQWVDPRKPLGTTWNLNTYVLSRRYGVTVVAQPQQ